MPGVSSLRPDLPPWRDGYCLCYEWRLVKSRRREPETGILPTHTSHPFSCSSQLEFVVASPRTRSVVVGIQPRDEAMARASASAGSAFPRRPDRQPDPTLRSLLAEARTPCRA